MKITFNPCNTDDTLDASVDGDVLTLNGEAFDFTPLEEGDVLPQEAVASSWVAGPVTRVDGEIALTLRNPYAGYGTLAQRFPAAVSVTQGPVPIPSAD